MVHVGEQQRLRMWLLPVPGMPVMRRSCWRLTKPAKPSNSAFTNSGSGPCPLPRQHLRPAAPPPSIGRSSWSATAGLGADLVDGLVDVGGDVEAVDGGRAPLTSLASAHSPTTCSPVRAPRTTASTSSSVSTATALDPATDRPESPMQTYSSVQTRKRW
jgi:hypothetical protein